MFIVDDNNRVIHERLHFNHMTREPLSKGKQKMVVGSWHLLRAICHSTVCIRKLHYLRARTFSHLSISEKRRFQMGDYAANNIKIFIARRLIESNEQRLSGTLLPEVPWLPRGRHAGASGFSRECVGTTYAHLMPGAHHGPVTTEYQRDRRSTQTPKFSAHSLASRNTAHKTFYYNNLKTNINNIICSINNN